MTYWPGSVIRVETEFTVGEVYTDPDTVILRITEPDGTTTPYEYPDDVTKDGTGIYYRNIEADTAGLWRWRWEGTGAAAGPDEGSFYVSPSLVGSPGHCTWEDVQAARRGLPASLEGLVQDLIARASVAVDDHGGRHFGIDSAASDRIFELGAYRTSRVVLIDDLSAAPTQAAIVDETDTDTATLTVATDLVLLPRNRRAGYPIEEVKLRASAGWGYGLRLRGVWGWPAIHQGVREATITTVVDWLKASQALTDQTPDLMLETGQLAARGLPQKARDLLRPRRRPGIH